MATIFDFLQDIIVKKKGNLLDDADNEAQFSPYMIQRWLSFYDNETLKILNLTANRLYPTFEQKKDWYKFYLMLIPKSRFRRLPYIKKTKEKETEEKKEHKEVIDFLAKNHKLSKREIKEYIEILNLDIKDLKKKL